MKSILISIKPKWCELIAKRAQTVEVRSKKPPESTPFKVYIYCTGVKGLPLAEYVNIHAATGGVIDDWSGKIIGEFVCDRITDIEPHPEFYSKGYDIDDDLLGETCLDRETIKLYGRGGTLYGWHISDLKIYDDPLSLTYFGLAKPPQMWEYVEG